MGVEANQGRLFCNTADVHFGPQFDSDEECERFIRWCFADGHGDPRAIDVIKIVKLQAEFRAQQRQGIGPQEARLDNWIRLTPGIEHCTRKEQIEAYLKAFPGRTILLTDELVGRVREIAKIKPAVVERRRIEAARDLGVAIHELLDGGGVVSRAVSCIEAALKRLKHA